jgi:S-DNA-T family DNA segregation ATPase FtsK/SpoIIIE
MPKARERSESARGARTRETSSGLPRPWGEFLGIALLAIGVLMVGGLCSYQFGAGNLMGPVGRLVASALYATLGMGAYLLVLGVLGLGIKALLGETMEIRAGEGMGFASATIAGCVLLHVTFPEYRSHGLTAGGLTGEVLGEVGLGLFDRAGTYLIALALLAVGLFASTPLSVAHIVAGARLLARGTVAVGVYLWGGVLGLVEALRGKPAADDELEEEADELDEDEDEEEEEEDEEEEAEAAKPKRARKRAPAAAPLAALGPAAEEAPRSIEPVLPPSEPRKNRKLAKRPEDLPEIVVTAPAKPEEAAKAPVSPVNPISPVKRKDRSLDAEEVEVGDESTAPKRRRKPAATTPEPAAMTPELAAMAPEIAVDEDVDPVRREEREPREAEADDAPMLMPRAGKKPPPRPQELARAEGSTPVQMPLPDGEAVKPERIKAIPGIVRLTPGPFLLPPSKLFELPDQAVTEVDKGFVLEQAERIEHALSTFKVTGKVTKIHPGPVITRYEFKPDPGVKLSRIESLENDLAMALEAISIRILAPIPGKATVGFEVPNVVRETVAIKEILDSEGFEAGRTSKLPIALGKNITGKPISIDLAKAPHLLVAGATGSGKSVGVNAMICSLLYSCTPEDVRMIMIDPKMLELSIYKDIPHLLLPVITDAEAANLALRWAVDEMERRYAVLSDAQVRDIGGYNKKLPLLLEHFEAEKRMLAEESALASREAEEEGEDAVASEFLAGIAFDPDGHPMKSIGGDMLGAKLGDRPEKMPYIVIIIDEFADLMMVASKEVETSVARIAAKARACGIHLILATQRPSVDVITGTIKNNFPSRIAFQVTSDIDSRTILDGKGAKQLLGMGDMLYMDRGGQPQRVHGCYVSEDEILKVVAFIKKQARPVYNHTIAAKRDEDAEDEPNDRRADPLYDKAVQIVAETRKVSTSMIQRRLNIGYNRAAKIVEQMEEDGVIGPARGTAPREVLVQAA